MSEESVARRRELLKQYYAQQAVETIPVDTFPKRADPIDIDSTSYHPELAYNKQLKEDKLTELITTNNMLVTDIKELDGNVKSLVYQNYSKFLSATDAILKIKTTAANMDQQVHALESKMGSITNELNNLTNNLSTKKLQLEKYNGIHSLVKKLNFVITLPNRLIDELDQKNYAEAVMFYTKTSNLLAHYSHLPMFKHVQDECNVIMQQIGVKVQKRVFSGTGNSAQLAEGIGLMVGLETLPAADLAKEYIYRMSNTIDKVFESVQKISLYSNSPTTPSAKNDNPNVSEFSTFNTEFLTELSRFVECYDAFFLNKMDFDPRATKLESLKCNCFAKSLSDVGRKQAADDLSHFLQDKEDRYFQLLDKMLKLPDDLRQVSPNLFVSILSVLRKDLNIAKALQKFTKIESRLSKLTITVLDRIIQGVFGRVKQDFFIKLKEINDANESQVFNIVRHMTNWIKEALIAKALPVLENFIDPSATHSFSTEEVLLRIHQSLHSFWIDLSSEMLGTGRNDVNPYYIILSRLSMDWSKSVIEAIYSMYTQRIFLQGAKLHIQELSEIEISKVSAKTSLSYQTLAHSLLRRYLQVKLNNFIFLIRKYVDDLAVKSVNGTINLVSPIWKTILSSFSSIMDEVKISFKADDGNDKKLGKLHKNQTISHGTQSSQKDLKATKTMVRKVSNAGLPSSTGFQKDNILDTLDKLFEDRLTYLPAKVELKLASVQEIIMKCLLKCLIEEIRQISITDATYRQIQIDCYYIRIHYWEFLEEKTFNNLLDEVLKSAFLQCINSNPPSIGSLELDKIIADTA